MAKPPPKKPAAPAPKPQAPTRAAKLLDALASKKPTPRQSGSAVSTLAAKVLSGEKLPTLADSKQLAASVLSQDQTPGQKKKP